MRIKAFRQTPIIQCIVTARENESIGKLYTVQKITPSFCNRVLGCISAKKVNDAGEAISALNTLTFAGTTITTTSMRLVKL